MRLLGVDGTSALPVAVEDDVPEVLRQPPWEIAQPRRHSVEGLTTD